MQEVFESGDDSIFATANSQAHKPFIVNTLSFLINTIYRLGMFVIHN